MLAEKSIYDNLSQDVSNLVEIEIKKMKSKLKNNLNKIIDFNREKIELAQNKKQLGQVFTSQNIVNLMLDNINYQGQQDKTILEPSCGDGAFLKEIIKRCIENGIQNKQNLFQIKNSLENNIYAIELDKNYYSQCIHNLNEICEQYNMINIDWKIYNDNALTRRFDFKFDFIVGNPPYIRVHNLEQKQRDFLKQNYHFCFNGSTDIYYAFYEYAIRHIKENGKISYITPNSFMRNASGKALREYIAEHDLLEKLIDYKEQQIFENVSVYSAIMILSKNNSYFEFYEKDKFIKEVNIKNFKNEKWNFNLPFKKTNTHKDNKIIVSNGFATLGDKYYIADSFNIERELLKPIMKASTGELKQIIFPYKLVNSRYEIIRSDELREKYPLCYAYFENHKEQLLNRDIDKNYLEFYQYGRSQAIQSIHNKKIVVSGLVNDKIKFYEVEKDVMVYSGLFIVADELEEVKEKLKSSDFFNYIQNVGKDMRSGWKSFNSGDVRRFL